VIENTIAIMPIVVGYAIIVLTISLIVAVLTRDKDPWPYVYDEPFNMDEGEL
jgi:hypothetical protein